MSIVETVSVSASILLAALASLPATAELPMHPNVAAFQPAPLHEGSFGSAVAISNGIAFVGNFDGLPTPYVDVFGLTSTGSWVRTRVWR
jgi:transketolase N-terminal domain/subunit